MNSSKFTIISTVVGVHIAILLLVYGGLSTLGIATAFIIPIIGCTAGYFYQLGWNKCENKHKKICKRTNLNFFRG